MSSSLPGIIKLSYIDCQLLPKDITLKAMAGVLVTIASAATEIPFVGIPTCETESQFDNNSQIEKTTLSFNTTEIIPTDQHLAFIIKTVQGNSFVIGTKEQPFPTIKISTTTGTPDGDPSVRKYEVTFTARKSLTPCIF